VALDIDRCVVRIREHIGGSKGAKTIPYGRKVSTLVHDKPPAAVVKMVVETLWAALGRVGRGGTPRTINRG
jgi:hypothetical protein